MARQLTVMKCAQKKKRKFNELNANSMRMSIAAKSGRKNEKCVNQNVKVITSQQSRQKAKKQVAKS